MPVDRDIGDEIPIQRRLKDQKIGNVVDQLLLLCFHYDPKAGRYTATVRNLVRGGAAITLLLLAGFVTIMLRRERAGPAKPPR